MADEKEPGAPDEAAEQAYLNNPELCTLVEIEEAEQSTPPDWRRWYSMAVVSLVDAVQLSYDCEPDPRVADDPTEFAILDWGYRMDVAKSYVIAEATLLPAIQKEGKIWVKLPDFAKLAKHLEWRLPAEFRGVTKGSESTLPGDAPLNVTERKTMNKLIYAMAVQGYDYDPENKKNTATGEKSGSIAADTQKAGCTLSHETVSKYLRTAAAAVRCSSI